MAPDSERPRRRISGCAIALLVVAFLVCAAIVVILIELPAIEGVYTSAKSAVSEMMAVRAAVQARTGVADVEVMVKYEGGNGKTLSFRLTNAPFARNLSDAEAEVKAKEIAATARDTLSSPGSYRNFEVVFVNEPGSGIRFSSVRTYRFQNKDLPPAKPR